MSAQFDRVNSLRKIIENNKQALLITNEIDVYYFSGFQKSEGAFLVTSDAAYLLVDFRYTEAAKKHSFGCEVVEYTSLTVKLKELFDYHGIDTVLIQSSAVKLSTYHLFIKEFNSKGISVVFDDRLDKAVQNLRIIKSDDEVLCIEKAQRITEKAFYEVLNYVKPGVSERTVAVELEYLMKKYGAQDISFDLITITGKKTSLPHGVPSDDIISEGDFFTMDIGAVYNGYHSDMTRTVAVKSCSDEKRDIYDIVLKAQTTALEAVKAGVNSTVVDKSARDIITEAGYGKCFGHSTGHGVGLDIHELPAVSTKSGRILDEGMVITVEPGIYLEGKFGVRIEDMVLVTKNGYKNFATISKDLIIV